MIDRQRLAALHCQEEQRFIDLHPRSAEMAAGARTHLLGGVPMAWMTRWPGSFPLFFDTACGARFTDVDGHEYVDFCLGDTGAMTGHALPQVADALHRQAMRGITTMLPNSDAAWVGEELARRFGLPVWQMAMTATDANRFVLRFARHLTGRSKVLVFDWCYHGSVDETLVVIGPDGRPQSRPGSIGPQVDPTHTSVVVPFNDLAALEAALAEGDVACVLAEPALTNMGIVLPDSGYWEAATKLIKDAGSLLVIDETHTFSAGPGGCTLAWGLQPDIVTMGKSIAGGVPIGAYGVTAEIDERIQGDPAGDYVDTGGVGGTLAGNALSMAAARGTLEHVLTDEAFARMCDLGAKMLEGMQAVIDRHDLPWVVEGLGARAEFRFCADMPKNGTESHDAHDDDVEEWLHLVTLNNGILVTPFHNMCLVCPDTTEADVDRLIAVLDQAAAELRAA